MDFKRVPCGWCFVVPLTHDGCNCMNHGPSPAGFRLASGFGIEFPFGRMSLLPTADLLALDTTGLKSRLSKLRRYL
jgi:hypothetical protein